MTPSECPTQRNIDDGDRFGFGANWSQFLRVLDAERAFPW